MSPTLLDNLAEYIVVTWVNADGTSQAHSLQPFLFSMRNNSDRAQDPRNFVGLQDGIDQVRPSEPNRLFIGQIVVSYALGEAAVHSANRKDAVRHDERKEPEIEPLPLFETPV